MKKFIKILLILLSIFIISCNKNNNPVSNENNPPQNPNPGGTCSFAGIDIEFADSCSYNFIMNFLSGLDSIVILNKSLGSTFYLYADSSGYNYWEDYFKDDSTIQDLYGYKSSDSLIIVIKSTGEKSLEEEKYLKARRILMPAGWNKVSSAFIRFYQTSICNIV